MSNRTISRKKTLFSTAFNIGLLLLIVGCDSSQKAAKSGTGSESAFKVALLTPGPVSDQSWNSGAYQGLLRIRDSLGANVSNIQTKTPAEFEDNFRQYGSQGYALVFGHGFEYQDAAKRVAPEFPKTVFVTTSGTTTGPNLAGLAFGFAEPSYLAGMLAAAVTKTNKLGVIGGTELPPVVESFRAFEQGARAMKPGISVVTSYVGNWDDVSAGKEQALAQISRGVDVIFQNADAAGLGVFQAAREKKSVSVIGSNSNQNSVAPDVTLGSVVIDLPLALLTIAKQVKGGSFQPGVIKLGESTRVVTLVLNPALRDRIPANALAKIDSLQTAMSTGAFKLPASADTTASKH